MITGREFIDLFATLNPTIKDFDAISKGAAEVWNQPDGLIKIQLQTRELLQKMPLESPRRDGTEYLLGQLNATILNK